MALPRSLFYPSLYPQTLTLTLTPSLSTKIPAIATRRPRGRARAPLMATSRDPTKLVTFLGKGGAGKTTAAVLAAKKASTSFTDSNKFRCYLVMDPNRSITITSALRYWGCAIQAGTQISGALGFAPPSSSISQEVAGKFTPLSVGTLPYLSIDSSLDWDAAISSLSQDTEDLLTTKCKCSHPSVTFDPSQKSVKLFMPGFDKSEIKLYQYRGGSELLVEAGDQRRIIKLPLGLQGKVSGAKFIDRNLVVKLR